MGVAQVTDIESEYRGPKRGADRAVLLAHGAGSDLRAPALRLDQTSSIRAIGALSPWRGPSFKMRV